MFKLSVCRHIRVLAFVAFACLLAKTQALSRRCYECRSRGELGSCKDPFKFNSSDVDNEPGLSTVSCPSGWCGKVIEGGGAYAVDDYDQAIQRMCVNRGPDDNQDRCAITAYNYKKVYMCLCQGDLCNSAPSTRTGALWWWWWWWSSSLLHHYSPLLSIIFSYTTLLVIPSSNIFFRIHFS